MGMRWPEKIARNVALAESFRPAFDMAGLPRATADIYRAEDEQATGPASSGNGRPTSP